MSTHKKYCLLLGILLDLMVVQYARADKFYGSVSAVSEESDNATKSAVDPMSERQNQYGLSLGGELDNSILNFRAEYDATARTYAEQSQENNNRLEGKSIFQIGKRAQPANLLLEHSRISVLKKPDDINLLANQDERDITSITPLLRGRISSSSNIFVEGKFIKVNYLESDHKDSQRDGGVLGFEHRISATDSLQVLTHQTDIQFDHSPLENYVYRYAEVVYSTELRQVSYSAHVGVNQSRPENGDAFVRPKYTVNFTYDTGIQRFSLSFLQELTDASLGGGNKTTAVEQPTGADSAHNIDRFERKHLDAYWDIHVLCESCAFVLGAYRTQDRYLPSEQLSTQQGWNIGFNYSLSMRSKILAKISKSSSHFTDSEFGENFKTDAARVEFRHDMNDDFSLSCHLSNEKRDSLAGGESYSEQFVGAGINYIF